MQAANGDVVHVGDDLTGNSFTRITNTFGGPALIGVGTGPTGTGLEGDSAAFHGVEGHSGSNYGVVGYSSGIGAGAGGVYGNAGQGYGVLGWGNVGVVGQSSAHQTGVLGYAGSGAVPAGPPKTGVYGEATEDGGSHGVHGKTTVGQGVRGEATTTGIGVVATAPLTGVALLATGKVAFSRSGRATMAAGTSSKTISLAGVSTGSLIFAVLGSNQSGRWVRAVVPASGSFTIYLNTTVLSSTYVSWFVLN